MSKKRTIDTVAEVSRKQFLTLLAPIAEQLGIDTGMVLAWRVDATGIEVDHLDTIGEPRAVRTARVHVFDAVVY